MKKIMNFIVILLMVFVSYSFPAAEENKNMMDKGMMKKGMMRDHGKMMCGNMGKDNMCGNMMRSMVIEKSVVATADGGVVVSVGNKILKYDKDLNLKKETEIKIDAKEMHKTMMQMMENCPMSEMMPKEESQTSAPGNVSGNRE